MQTPPPAGIDPAAVFDMASRIGFPLLFVLGQLREWWYVKPHVDLLTGRLKELATQLEQSEASAARATGVAEDAHDLARQALELSRGIEAGIARLEDAVTTLSRQLEAASRDRRP